MRKYDTFLTLKKHLIAVLTALLFASPLILYLHCTSSTVKTGTVIAQEGIMEEITDEAPDAEEIEEEPLLVLPDVNSSLPVSSFDEVWVYVVAGNESAYNRRFAISDIGYFGAEIDSYGKLTDVPRRSRLSSFQGRVHLVVACNSRSLTHFVLMPGSEERKALIADLVAETKNYDGLQIDFENVPARDGEVFLSFLKDLRASLPDKMLTAALPARTQKIANDVYDYEKIAPFMDRILVMAYDEHWSGSKPGSVASLSWCKRVAEYSLRAINKDKLIMGIPFYGRAWGDQSTSRALVYSTTERIMKERDVTEIRRENGIPVFDYDVSVSVKVYYEDEYSLAARMDMYKSIGVKSAGFWRLGQETIAVWRLIQLTAK
jgi:spore germination protein YaaH